MNKQFDGCLFVFLPGPAVHKMVVKEDSDVVLNCSFSSASIRGELFDWKKDGQEVFMYDAGQYYSKSRTGQDKQFIGRVEHFPDQLDFGNASIVIRKAEVNDGGIYTCVFPKRFPERRSHIALLVGESP